MRPVPFLRLCSLLAAATACDGSIVVEGYVSDEQSGEPIANASVYLGDREFDDLSAYFETRDPDALGAARYRSDDAGFFVASELLAGPKRHDVWLVVHVAEYQAYAERVWRGKGFPDESTRSVDVELVR